MISSSPCASHPFPSCSPDIQVKVPVAHRARADVETMEAVVGEMLDIHGCARVS